MIQKSKTGLATSLLIVGLLMATTTPSIFRQLHAPDYAKGFVMGLGIGLEVVALVLFLRLKKEKAGV